MTEATLTILADADSYEHNFQLLLSEKQGFNPQFKLKLFKALSVNDGPELLRTITIPVRPAVALAHAILDAQEQIKRAKKAVTATSVVLS